MSSDEFMTPNRERDIRYLARWAAERNIPFMEDDWPFLLQEIAKLNITVERWCELQDKQQAQLEAAAAPKTPKK